MVAGGSGIRFCVEGSEMEKAGKPAVRRWVIKVAYWVEGEKEPGTMRMVGFVVAMIADLDCIL
jgi:hypothetical protein